MRIFQLIFDEKKERKTPQRTEEKLKTVCLRKIECRIHFAVRSKLTFVVGITIYQA